MQIGISLPELWMWETGRKAVLDVPPGVSLDGLLVTFARSTCRDGLTVRPQADACGHMECEVPSQLLDEAGALVAVASVEGRVVGEARASVRSRAKPSDYVYAPTQTVTLETVSKELRAYVEERVDEVSAKVDDVAAKVDELGSREPESMTDGEVDSLFAD